MSEAVLQHAIISEAGRMGATRARVCIIDTGSASYPRTAPYHPSQPYPEYPFGDAFVSQPNLAYDGVRRALGELGCDAAHFGSASWNPLGEIIRPGMTVVVKPNFVLSHHTDGKDLYSIITHPSVLRAVADYCWIALEGRGEIIFADAPQYNCDFSELLRHTGLDSVCRFFDNSSGPKVSYRDLRNYWSNRRHFPSMKQGLGGDPGGRVRVDLGKVSSLYGKPNVHQLYGAVYNRDETISNHHGDIQAYEISGTILSADVVISVPKLKVHKKVGVTLNAKGLVGIATNKNMVVHYTLGSPSEGGDQYPEGLFNPVERTMIKTERWMYDHLLATNSKPLEFLHRSIYWLHNHTTRRLGLKVAEHKRLLDAGNWYGNDSAWRMTVDLLRIFYFADREGRIRNEVQRRLFSFVDGIVGGEGNGPLTPDPKPSAVLIAGENPLAVDLVAARLMGFDSKKLKIYSHALTDEQHNFGVRSTDDIEVVTTRDDWKNCISDLSSRFLDFRPHPGWVNQIEVEHVQGGGNR
jgi:uncharacterized protein (DUF362 family)